MNKYEDMINLPRHISKRREPMDIKDRAAQFSPFAALTGHGAAVDETARLTEERIELDPYIKADLNNKLQELKNELENKSEDKLLIKVTYFLPDEIKKGGEYISKMGYLIKIDEYKKNIILEGNLIIPIKEIVKLEKYKNYK